MCANEIQDNFTQRVNKLFFIFNLLRQKCYANVNLISINLFHVNCNGKEKERVQCWYSKRDRLDNHLLFLTFLA